MSLNPQTLSKIWRDSDYGAELLFGTKRWEGQSKIATSVVEHKYTAAATCHGIGKTELGSELAVEYVMSHYPAYCIITSASWDTAKETILARIRSKAEAIRSRFQHWVIPDGAGGMKKVEIQKPSLTQWYPFGQDHEHAILCCSPVDAERAAGRHNAHVFVIVDEASALDRRIFNTFLTVTIRPNDRILMIGNPLEPSGPFFDAFTQTRAKSDDDRSGWHCINISAYDSPNVKAGGTVKGFERLMSAEGVESLRRMYADDPVDVQPRIYGEFPDTSDLTVISQSALRNAAKVTQPEPSGKMILSVDVAYGGGDQIVFALRDDKQLYHLEGMSGRKTPDIERLILGFIKDWKVDQVYLDATGNPSLWHYLEERKIREIVPVVYSRRAHDADRFINARAEFYWGFRTALAQGFHIPESLLPPLLSQSGIQMKTVKGKKQIEEKADFKERIGRSPDHLDAVAQSFYRPAGERVFEISDSAHKCGMAPIVAYDHRTQQWTCHYAGLEAALKWGGALYRAMWIGIDESSCVWAHVDRHNRWRVFDAYRSDGTIAEFLKDVKRRSVANGVQHTYMCDVFSSQDADDLMHEVHAEMMRGGTWGALPYYVEPGTIRGKSGVEALETLLLGTLALDDRNEYWAEKPMERFRHLDSGAIWFWPQAVMDEVDKARVKPPPSMADPDEVKPHELIGGGGGYVKALRLLMVESKASAAVA